MLHFQSVRIGTLCCGSGFFRVYPRVPNLVILVRPQGTHSFLDRKNSLQNLHDSNGNFRWFRRQKWSSIEIPVSENVLYYPDPLDSQYYSESFVCVVAKAPSACTGHSSTFIFILSFFTVSEISSSLFYFFIGGTTPPPNRMDLEKRFSVFIIMRMWWFWEFRSLLPRFMWL